MLHKKIIVLVLTLSLFLMAEPAFAKPNFVEATNPGGHNFSLPAKAVEVAPNVFSLGTAYDAQSDSMVEGYAIVHKKADTKGNATKAPKGGTTCYAFLADGAKWKGTPEPWVMNPANTSSLNEGNLFNLETQSIQTWETAANFDILGDGTATSATLVADQSAPDGVNEVYFADLGNNNTIAVTIVWGTFGGPTFNRKLVEWDQVFSTHFAWSDAGAANAMDFQNIATHELGHAMGMAHPSNTCTEETMYAYANFGETKKRDLNPGDIAGINKLY